MAGTIIKELVRHEMINAPKEFTMDQIPEIKNIIRGQWDAKVVSTYELTPLETQGQKSFYGKAKVHVFDNGAKVLQSYDTMVMMKTAGGDFWWLAPYGELPNWSATTRKHIKAFSGLTTKDYHRKDIGWTPHPAMVAVAMWG